MERAMRGALEDAGLEPGDVNAVWSSACGFSLGDEAEANAISRVFGDEVKVLRPKLKLGEPIGAGGPLCAALAMKGWDLGDEGSPPGPVLVNSMSLGGTNFSIVLGGPPASG